MIKRIPFLTIFIIFYLIGCFYIEYAVGAINNFTLLISYFGLSRSSIIEGHFLRLVTSGFFHVNIGHLISNIIGLLIFMGILEVIVGKYYTMLVIFASALGGALGSIIIEMVQFTVGSSTILFGVYGALGVLLLRYRLNLNRYFYVLAALWIFELVVISVSGYISLKVVDQGAHIGGFIAGVLTMLCVTRDHTIYDLRGPVSLTIKIVLIAMSALFIIGFIKEVFLFL